MNSFVITSVFKYNQIYRTLKFSCALSRQTLSIITSMRHVKLTQVCAKPHIRVVNQLTINRTENLAPKAWSSSPDWHI